MIKSLEDSLRGLADAASLRGRMEARNQVMDIISNLLDDPKFIAMSNTEVVRYLTQAIKLEFDYDEPGATDVQQ